MAFPATRLPVKVFLAPGADLSDGSAGWVWTDITSSVRLRPGIRLTHGRADESARVAPSGCRLMLDNRTGDFTPRNPLGQWYGQLGRNTPLRVAIRRAEDDFDRTASSGWGTEPLWGGTWTTSGGSASDYSVSGGKGNISSSTTSVRRLSLLDVGVTDARITVDTVNPVVPTGASISHWVLGRSDGTDFYAARLDITTTGSVNLLLFRLAAGLGVTLVTASAIGTHSAGDTWRIVFEYVGTALRAKAWEPSGTEPSAWQVDTTDTTLTSGTQCGAGVRLESGNTSGTQTVTFDDFTVDMDRFSGFVSSWPPRWDKSGADATVPIEANGILRRLGQGTPPSHSPVRRSVMSPEHTGLLAYWPCEDSSHAQQAGSAIAGQPAMTVSGSVDFAAVDLNTFSPPFRIGSQPVPDLSGGGSLRGMVPTGVSSPVEWSVQFAGGANTIPTSSHVLAEWTTTGGTYARWTVQQITGAGTTDVVVYDSAGAATTILSAAGWVTSTELHRVDAQQNGANVDVRLWYFRGYQDTATLAGVTLGRVTSFAANPTSASHADSIGIGHVMVWGDYDAPGFDRAFVGSFPATDDPWWSYYGERFDDRLARLCAQEGVSLTVPTVSADFAVQMGAQPSGTFLDLLYQCAEADQGVIYEAGFGLGYTPREARYNRTVDLALDFDAGQIAEPPEPTDDDYNLVNRVKLTRSLGSSVVVEDTDSIADVGVYETETTVNLAYDTELADHAAWRVHLGS